MIIACDFDGVLIERKSIPRPEDFEKDKPMKDAREAVKFLIERGHEVFILTSRRADNWPKIRRWLEKHDFPWLRITDTKENATIYLDDRAIRFTNWLDFIKLIE